MRITASHIINWAATHSKEAQTDLPRWIRRLCFEVEATRQLSFPAGDSSFVPGWDGLLFSERGNAWIPEGSSRWEIGCNQAVQNKANSDYEKRTTQTSEDERLASTFVFVTPRRWTTKLEWLTEHKEKSEWADIRVYDADDLEQWLEQSPAVALQFGEALGLFGQGVESCSQHWKSWSQQCSPIISTAAMFMDRTQTRDVLITKIAGALTSSASSNFLAIRADSVEEAAAFVACSILEAGALANQSLVVTGIEGWRYVHANPQLKVAIAASTELAAKPEIRPDLLIVVPYAIGSSLGKSEIQEIVLDRPNIYEFEKALIVTGIETSDAKRFALTAGRSWTVFRRQRATNPAIRSPAWLNIPQADSLAMLCLLGTWSANHEADKQVVARLAARPYDAIEGDLRRLAKLDDAPVLSIGSVWKAKSPLELLNLFGDRITGEQLERFFAIAEEMLSAPDPELELPEEDRWAARIHGKAHPFSGLLFDSICDTLIKLAVRGPEQQGLDALRIADRVTSLVRKLLDEVDAVRWLSLAAHLPALAEAAPGAFLTAVEKSLRQAEAPVTRLFTETSGSGFGGRCWHSGILWALEALAWDATRLSRVALILAQLSHTPIKGNWANTPSSSLLGLFRSWLPQTAAPLSDRIKVLDLVIQKEEVIALGLIQGLASPFGNQFATPASRPKWREDDAGAGNGVPGSEVEEMLVVAKERLFQLSAGNALRLAKLLQNNLLRNEEEMPRVLALMSPFLLPNANDEDREILRAALRKTIHWHRSYDEAPKVDLDIWLLEVEACYDDLAPAGLVSRHRWLFDSHSVDLPKKESEDDIHAKDKLLAAMRADALAELYTFQNMALIEELIQTCKEPGTVGASLAELRWSEVDWAAWIADKGGDYIQGHHMTWCISTLLCALPSPDSEQLLHSVLAVGAQKGWGAVQQARFLNLAPFQRITWQLVAICGTETEQIYWQTVRPNYPRGKEDLSFVLQQLLNAKRPRTALIYCQFAKPHPDPKLLFLAMQLLIAGQEPEGQMLEPWRLGKLLDQLEKSHEIEKMALIQLEFGLFPALEYGDENPAVFLYESIMSEPPLFAELISLQYKPNSQEREEAVTEAARTAASHAWKILHHCKRMPGITKDGHINHELFTWFIETVRDLCGQADMQCAGDRTLGKLLAHAPADEDGTWPFSPAREILERSELNDMRRGFFFGALNKRGLTTRSPWDGGGQERNLATYYRDQARLIQYTHPNLSSLFEEIANHYERDGKDEDNEANLRKEGF